MRYDPDQPGQRTPWGHMTWMVSGEVGNATELTVGRVTIHPGKCNPRHCHPTCEEVLHLLAGELEHSLGDRMVRLSAGDSIVIPAGVFHNAVNVGTADADMIVTFSSAQRDFVLEDANAVYA